MRSLLDARFERRQNVIHSYEPRYLLSPASLRKMARLYFNMTSSWGYEPALTLDPKP
jgi:hypothetical protein